MDLEGLSVDVYIYGTWPLCVCVCVCVCVCMYVYVLLLLIFMILLSLIMCSAVNLFLWGIALYISYHHICVSSDVPNQSS